MVATCNRLPPAPNTRSIGPACRVNCSLSLAAIAWPLSLPSLSRIYSLSLLTRVGFQCEPESYLNPALRRSPMVIATTNRQASQLLIACRAFIPCQAGTANRFIAPISRESFQSRNTFAQDHRGLWLLSRRSSCSPPFQHRSQVYCVSRFTIAGPYPAASPKCSPTTRLF